MLIEHEELAVSFAKKHLERSYGEAFICTLQYPYVGIKTNKL